MPSGGGYRDAVMPYCRDQASDLLREQRRQVFRLVDAALFL